MCQKVNNNKHTFSIENFLLLPCVFYVTIHILYIPYFHYTLYLHKQYFPRNDDTPKQKKKVSRQDGTVQKQYNTYLI